MSPNITTTEEIQPQDPNENQVTYISALDSSEETVNSLDERPVMGSIKGQIYIEYLKAGLHIGYLVALFLTLVAGEGLLISSVYWLSKWTQTSESEQKANHLYNISVFIILTVTTVVISAMFEI
jgi:hypothetical protein